MGGPFPKNEFHQGWQSVRRWTQESQVHKWVALLVACFAVQTALEVLGWLTDVNLEGALLSYVALPAWGQWNMGPFWTLLSYGLLHYGFMHLVLNSVMLYFAGHMLKTFWTDQQVIRLFLAGILSGGLAFVTLSVWNPEWKPLMGASAGVLAVLLAATRMSPRMPVYVLGFFKVPLWAISGLLVFFSLAGLSGPNGGGQVAHLGGALIGWLLGRSPQALTSFQWKMPRRRNRTPLRVVRDEPLELDAILEKISRVGYAKLSSAEKEFLTRYGQK